MQPLVIDEAQRRSVEKFIEAVIRDAHYKCSWRRLFFILTGSAGRKRGPAQRIRSPRTTGHGNVQNAFF